MKASRLFVVLSALMFSVTTSAYFYDPGQHSASRDVVTKRYKTKKVATPEYSPSHVLCITKRRYGSLIKERRCQTVAEWKQELNAKAMRQHLIRPSGKAASWEVGP